MYFKAILKTATWFCLLIALFLFSLSKERFYASGLDQKVKPKFEAGSLMRFTENLPNSLSFKAQKIENSFHSEVSHDVEGTLDQFTFSCDKLTLDKKTGLFLEGNVVIVDTIEKKSLYAPFAKIHPKEGTLEVFDNPVIVQQKGVQSKIMARRVLYEKTQAGYKASVEGPIECIVDDVDVKSYVPFKREKSL